MKVAPFGNIGAPFYIAAPFRLAALATHPQNGGASKHSGGKPFFSLNLLPRKRWGARKYIAARLPRKQVGKGGVAGVPSTTKTRIRDPCQSVLRASQNQASTLSVQEGDSLQPP